MQLKLPEWFWIWVRMISSWLSKAMRSSRSKSWKPLNWSTNQVEVYQLQANHLIRSFQPSKLFPRPNPMTIISTCCRANSPSFTKPSSIRLSFRLILMLILLSKDPISSSSRLLSTLATSNLSMEWFQGVTTISTICILRPWSPNNLSKLQCSHQVGKVAALQLQGPNPSWVQLIKPLLRMLTPQVWWMSATTLYE